MESTIGLGILWLLLSQVVALRLRKRLSDADRSAKFEQMAQQEIVALNRAGDMYDHEHYDLAVVEAWRAIELRLRRVLLQRAPGKNPPTAQKLIDLVAKLGLVREPSLGLLHKLRKQWAVAVSTEPVTKEAADAALHAARAVLATVALEDGSTH
jgi:hypothetical protein